MEIVQNAYYALGVGIQKGINVIIAPVLIHIFGASNYADYVLLYSVVQIAAIITSLAVVQVLIPFWYQKYTKEGLVGMLVVLITALTALLSPGAYYILDYANPFESSGWSQSAYCLTIIIFGYIYNINALWLSILRAGGKQKAFFAIATGALLIYILVLALMNKLGTRDLLALVLLNMVFISIQTLGYAWVARIRIRLLFGLKKYIDFTSRALKFSIPLTWYTLVALLALSIDKWVVKGYFSRDDFNVYVIHYQFSFALMILSVVIGMYNTPKLCELVSKNDNENIRDNIREHYILSLVGGAVLGVFIYMYAHYTGVVLSAGYWMLVIGFVLNSLYAVNSSLLTAFHATKVLALIGSFSTAGFIALLFIAGYMQQIEFVYWANIIYYAMLLLISGIALKYLYRERRAGSTVAQLD